MQLNRIFADLALKNIFENKSKAEVFAMTDVHDEDNNPEVILGKYKKMTSECQQLASKIQELTMERDEHRLVVDQLNKLEPSRKAFRLIGGVLVERTVEEVLPAVNQNFEGVCSRFCFIFVLFNLLFPFRLRSLLKN